MSEFVDDGSGLRRIKLEDLICKDCKHKILKSVLKCKMYERKSASVIKNNSCPLFQKEPKQ